LLEDPGGEKTGEWVGGGTSKRFVERVSKLTEGGCVYLKDWKGGCKQGGKLSCKLEGRET